MADRRRLSWKLALFSGVVLLAALLAALLIHARRETVPAVHLSADTLPANGISSAAVTVALEAPAWVPNVLRPWVFGDGPLVDLQVSAGHDLVRLGSSVFEPGRLRQDLIAGILPGSATIEVVVHQGDDAQRFTRTLELVPDQGDDDGDGFPNAVELVSEEDRTAFRRWFTAIAVAQVKAIAPDWPAIHQDCAGLLRYAYKEALRRHDAAWLEAHPGVNAATARDVGRFHYPDIPVIGTNLFRTGDPDAPFGPTATARVLRDENTVLVSRDVLEARNGDLLFFEHAGPHGPIIHSMIVVRHEAPAPRAPSGALEVRAAAPLEVVYHTGPEGEGVQVPNGSGTVRYLRLADLFQHPDPAWRPSPDNPAFSGVYRWRILWGKGRS